MKILFTDKYKKVACFDRVFCFIIEECMMLTGATYLIILIMHTIYSIPL